jgi:hypothetical protein
MPVRQDAHKAIYRIPGVNARVSNAFLRGTRFDPILTDAAWGLTPCVYLRTFGAAAIM